MTARHASRGFTLLEVLVAIAILGLGLTMILSSQVGLFSGASRGEHMTVATNLARCKMSELEVDLLKKGYPLTDEKNEGSCCGDEGEPGYDCSWKIERIELPPQTDLSADGGVGADGGASDPMAMIQKFSSIGNTASSSGAPGAPPSLQDISESVGQASLGGGIAAMAMGMVYPSLKPMLEASIRKVTLEVSWREGINKRNLVVTQYVTDPQQGQLIDPLTGLPVASASAGAATVPGAPGATLPGTTTTPKSPLGGLGSLFGFGK